MNATIVMPTLGAIIAPWQQHESLLIGKLNHFPKFTLANKDIFFVLLTITSLNIMYYNFACYVHFTAHVSQSPIKMKPLPLMWVGHQSECGHMLHITH